MKLVIDAGTYSIKLCLTDKGGKVLYKLSRPHHNKIKDVLTEELYKMLHSMKMAEDERLSVAVVGAMSHLLNLSEECQIDEEKAIEDGASLVAPAAQSIIQIGAQKTRYFEKTRHGSWEVRQNSNCSAGTGAFFEEQATRLQIPLEKISDEVAKAKTIPQIAGRCSVFSKTDMIHHMQEGVTTPDILNGLCYALVRNYKSSILHNRSVATPVYLAGGVMKNKGVLQAILDLLGLSDGDYILDDNSEYRPPLRRTVPRKAGNPSRFPRQDGSGRFAAHRKEGREKVRHSAALRGLDLGSIDFFPAFG